MTLDAGHHLIVLPILLPLICGALLIPVSETRHNFKLAVNLVSVLAQLAMAAALLTRVESGYWAGEMGVYLAANWVAPFGITLVADRLAALMLLLSAVLALAALLYASSRWSRVGVHFHSLFQFLLMGLNGAFLTHDLFNLFVFFEIMLAASYGLLLHGYTTTRIRAGMQYIAVNLAASLLFLIGVALIYGAVGTLNMSDLAARLPMANEQDLILAKIGACVLALAFLVKGAMWPLGFWLPTTYSAASPPVAAMLVLMTKVGAYAILRIWLLAFSDVNGPLAGFGFDVLLWGGVATIVFGSAGVMSSDDAGRMAGYAAIVSSGTLFVLIGFGQVSLITAALYYLLGSTLAVAAFVLLVELIERIRRPGASVLALTMEAFAVEETPEEPVGMGIPAGLAFLGLAFAASAAIIAGLPPLSGFVAKFGIFQALLNPGDNAAPSSLAWVLLGLIMFSGFAAILGMMRFGVRTFWASGAVTAPRLNLSEVLPVSLLLLLCVVLTLRAGPVFEFLGRTSADLHDRSRYVEQVLNTFAVPGVVKTEAQ